MNINLSRSLLPNSATALNLFSGFLSIIFASNNNFHLAALFIFIAAFFDLIDGLLARLTNSSSKFGVELDSLADVVSFGAAPSFLIYKSYLFQYDFIGILISSLILIFGAFRLARFNVQLENIKTKLDFNGLPIPVAA
ncbi:MAG: CDP-diacylglycerol--serine O-phosphatidyltransferase, partial [Melioribacteraceae bacterium]|nr:CDP-diacylglycerol--serine O-phosphatidyltransferase [Melioribacteraceae bacterium]